MHVIIPMAGTGQRFVDAGYSTVKPLIKVDNRTILEYILEMFDKTDEFHIIYSENFTESEKLTLAPLTKDLSCTFYKIPGHKAGPVATVLRSKVLSYIPENEEVIVTYCDNPFQWDYESFKRKMLEEKADGAILSHGGFHPHRLSHTKMAFMKISEDNVVTEIKEKECYTDTPMEEFASTGTYYFRRASDIKKYFVELVEKNINYNNEYYVTLVYNLMIGDGLKVLSYPTETVTVFGTPEELENFQAFQTILKGFQIRNEDDLVKSYRYWKKYNELRS